MWLYEIATLCDTPTDIHNLLAKGNYESMISMELCSDPMDYYIKLGEKFLYFFNKNLFDQNDFLSAIKVTILYLYLYFNIINFFLIINVFI